MTVHDIKIAIVVSGALLVGFSALTIAFSTIFMAGVILSGIALGNFLYELGCWGLPRWPFR